MVHSLCDLLTGCNAACPELELEQTLGIGRVYVACGIGAKIYGYKWLSWLICSFCNTLFIHLWGVNRAPKQAEAQRTGFHWSWELIWAGLGNS